MKLEPVAWMVSEDGRVWPTNSHHELMAFTAIPGTTTTPLYAIPPGYKLVPVEPTEAMWGGLARDLMFVLRQERPTPAKVFGHLKMLDYTIPQWLRDESEMGNLDHVISKGTCCVLIYKAMIAMIEGEQ